LNTMFVQFYVEMKKVKATVKKAIPQGKFEVR
jgi:hypothetical protein